MFAASQLWGKVGRAYMLALSERQYTKTYRENLDQALLLTLRAWLKLLDRAPRRNLVPEDTTGTDYVLFTDGYHPDRRHNETGLAQVGGVLFEQGGKNAPEFFAEPVKEELMDSWIKRVNQIVMGSSFLHQY